MRRENVGSEYIQRTKSSMMVHRNKAYTVKIARNILRSMSTDRTGADVNIPRLANLRAQNVAHSILL